MTVARTTQGEWATLPPGDGSYGDLVLFDVPSDGPPQPQHVGICVGGGRMVNAPHTGLNVEYDTIWDIPGSITVMGYRRIPFAPTPPQPVPSFREVGKMNATDPTTGGEWIVDLDGHVETWGGAPYCGGLNNLPSAGDWKASGLIWGLRASKDADGRWGYDIIFRHNVPFNVPGGAPGQYFSPYHFDRAAGT